jgi:hypothetical protein
MHALFHVVVVVGKDFMNQQGAAVTGGEIEFSKGGKELVVD